MRKLDKIGQNWIKLGETRRRLKLDEIGRKLSKIDENLVKVNWRKLEKTRQNWAKLGKTGRNWAKLDEISSKGKTANFDSSFKRSAPLTSCPSPLRNGSTPLTNGTK